MHSLANAISEMISLRTLLALQQNFHELGLSIAVFGNSPALKCCAQFVKLFVSTELPWQCIALFGIIWVLIAI